MTLRVNLFLASCVLASLLVAQDDAPSVRYMVNDLTEQPVAVNAWQGPTATIHFEEMEHDFGWVLQDSENAYVFKFKNTGNEPVIIESATGSCGCTVPDYPRHPILPGEESEINVVYKPGKQEGHQLKTVTVIANTKPAQTLLRIHAEVLTEDPGVASPPYTFEPLPPPVEPVFDLFVPSDETTEERIPMGPPTTILFNAYEHDFGKIPQGSENPYVFKFKNTGDVPLLITNATGSCGCTVPFYAKHPIQPGEESEIHVVYKPGKQEGHQQKTVTISANTEPGVTLLRITAEVLVVDSVTATSFLALDEEHQKDMEAIEEISPDCFVIFPNPTSHELRLDLKEHIGEAADVKIHDTTGREMLATRIASISSETSRLDVASFPSGIYIVTIQLEGGKPVSQCFVVDR